MIERSGLFIVMVLSAAALAHATEPTPAHGVILPRLSPRPIAVADCATTNVDLAGTWKFTTKAPADLAAKKLADVAGWPEIQVPGEWGMQGFTVKSGPKVGEFYEPGDAGGYFRTFQVPSDWNGKLIKLRCDAVYSDATVWVNGKEAGRHLGGFTPFELDVTALVKTGEENTIALAVKNESFADKLANGSRYANRPLGGVTRKIRLFVLPRIHLSRMHVATKFDKEYRNATLELDMKMEGKAEVALTLTAPDGSDVPLTPNRVAAGHASIPVANPAKWDNEHPNLYTLTVKLEQGGKLLEVVTQRVGFRQVEVRGNQMLVNGVPIKLRGVCRHEAHPLRGRSLTPELWRKDAELFREANCNYIRTSHYPPAEEFIEACDELGLFVECEAPFCWAQMTPLTAAQIPDLVTPQELEMLEAYRNHPAITHWSMGNESAKWNYFLPAAKLFKKLDPTRPINFSAWEPQADAGFCDIANNHYPGICGPKYPSLQGPAKFADSKRPTVFDEYCHLNSYNRRELATDPGLRDVWGLGLAAMWENIRKAQGCLGGAIWSGIDDTFFMPNGDTVGYGTWGPIDGWRRPKPEYWHMKKAYSPLRLRETMVPANQPVRLTVENRHSFTDLSEVRFEWKLGDKSGIAMTSAAPGKSGTLEIPVSGDGQLLEVRAISPRGFGEDVWQIALGTDLRQAKPRPQGVSGPVKLEKTAETFVIRGAGYTVHINARTGMISSPFTGPELMLLPTTGDNCGGMQMSGRDKDIAIFSDTCHDWKAKSVTAEAGQSGVTVRVEGMYAEAKGGYTYIFGNDGTVEVQYAFTVTTKGKCSPRQIGVALRLPKDCRALTWRRKAQWSAYPEDHIGRAEGKAVAFVQGVPLSGLAGPRARPAWSWSADANMYGSNDFRSTKMNILEAALPSSAGRGIRVLSDGSQHVRTWVDGSNTSLLVAEYTNHGSPAFFGEKVIPSRSLKAGSDISGKVRLEIH